MTLDLIRARVAQAAKLAGRDPGDVVLIAVSKMQPDEAVRAVLDQGHLVFGENRVQEAAGKWPKFAETYKGVELHLIGPLQSNKVRQAMGLANVIHSLDRPKLARAIARIAQETGACPSLFIQVNTGREPQKAGVLPDDVDSFVQECRELDLPVQGLMAIPPVGADPVPHFRALRDMAGRCGLTGLSMGMSGDFEQAIAQGATHIRVGSAIFGPRN